MKVLVPQSVRRLGLAFLVVFGSGGLPPGIAAAPEPESLPLSPAESLKMLHVRDGYVAELVAAEPLVKDPVGIAWGADGRLWVAEMADYPLGMDGNGKPGGRIRFLEDVDGDGRYDKSTVFLTGVNFPNGVKPWRNGVLVTAAPEIFYAEDTDGDGRADKRETLFTGFHEGNQQLRVNGLRWGLDNWVYCASGSHRPNYGADSRIRSIRTGTSIELGSRDFRFHPDSGEIDPQSGPTQFGRNRDDWGHWFGCMNSRPMWHYVLRDHYIRRNPHFAPPDPRRQLVVPLNPKVYPAKAPQKRFHTFQQSGRFTSACSPMVYRDELLFPRDGRRHGFSCEPFHNLVQHNILTEEGISFTARRSPKETEVDFFASKDRWCRPVMTRTGPDGALWVVDMYRYMIEHPQFLTPEGREELKPFYRAGDDRGRIYRIVPRGKPARKIPRLDTMTTSQLVAALESPNGWQRDMIQQLLIWRADKSATTLLERLAADSKNPLARLHALCTLDGLGTLSAASLMNAFADAHPEIRRHAIRLAETRFDDHPQFARAAAKLAGDPNAKVRLQLACSLGEWSSAETATTLTQLALKDAGDPKFAAAILSSVNTTNLNEMLNSLFSKRPGGAVGQLAGRLLALSVAFGDGDATLDALAVILRPDDDRNFSWQASTLAGLLDATQRQKTSLAKLAQTGGKRGQDILDRVKTLTAKARQKALDNRAADAERIAALRLLARQAASRSEDIQVLGRLLTPQTPPAIQAAVVSRLGSLSHPQVAPVLLDHWRSFGPALRARIPGVLATRPEWLTDLLDEIESERVAPADVDAGTRQQLLVYPNKAIRTRVARLLSDSGSTDRHKVLREYQAVLKLTGDLQRGAAAFKRMCAVCHKLDGMGYDVGPNLVSITDKRPKSLLTSILDPNAAVDPKYTIYVALTKNGRTFSGVLLSETGTSLTLLGQEDKRQVILRTELEELQSTGKSLMPDGVEKELTRQDLADLIAYVRRSPLESTTPTGSQ